MASCSTASPSCSKGPEAFAAILHTIGVPAPHLMAWLTILVEVFGGLAVLLGALVPLASLPMAAVLLVAIFTVHLPYGFSSIKLISVTSGHAQLGPPGYEITCSILLASRRSSSVVPGRGDRRLSHKEKMESPSESQDVRRAHREIFRARRVTKRTRSPR